MQHPEEKRAPTLKTGAVQKQVAGQLWPTGHGTSALAHINNHSTDLILLHSKAGLCMPASSARCII